MILPLCPPNLFRFRDFLLMGRFREYGNREPRLGKFSRALIKVYMAI
jgi:hypothetical protein